MIATIAMLASAYAETKVNVLGAVNRQGHFVKEKGQITLLDAIGLAEGVSKEGNSTKILIRREGDEVSIIEVNLQDVIHGRAKNPILNDGDLVYVIEKLF